MAIIRHRGDSAVNEHDDTTSEMGVSTTKEAIDELDRRVDLLELNNSDSTGTFEMGWKDLTADMKPSEERTSAPAFIELPNGIGYYHFADDSNADFKLSDEQYVFVSYHVDHDYVVGTEMFPHIHWAPGSTSTGDVVWSFEWVKAKGHNQNESLTVPLTRIDLVQSAKGLEYEHMVVECNPGEGFVVSEPDVIITCKITRRAGDPRDTFIGNVAGITADIHYQSDHETTVGKAPDFNVA